MSALRHRWEQTLYTADVTARCATSADRVYQDILSAYGEQHRRYHGVEHLRSCFNVLDRYFTFSPEVQPAVEMALWFHDFRYDTQAADNEEQSALYAKEVLQERLELSEAFAQDVHDLILATKHRPPTSVVGLSLAKQIVSDVDLSILGAQPDVFDVYERQIRKEYSWVPEDAFREGRTRIIREFLDLRNIFYSDALHDAGYEDRAYANLQRSLRTLTGHQ